MMLRTQATLLALELEHAGLLADVTVGRDLLADAPWQVQLAPALIDAHALDGLLSLARARGLQLWLDHGRLVLCSPSSAVTV